ncbi:MAG: flavodoxin domain-containing protein [Niabella sp.]
MLSEDKRAQLQHFIASLTPNELIWVSGYLAGIASGNQQVAALPMAAGAPKKIHLVYGTETGNAKKLATQLAGIAKKKGVQVKLTGLDQYKFADIGKENYFFVVISTQGEGEPPVLAKKFYDQLHEQQVDLKKMKFGVLALGDSSYPQFCKTGEDVDARLEALGAERVLPLKKCDVDYDEDALQWIENVVSVLGSEPAAAAGEQAPSAKKSTGKKYYKGTVGTIINLNDRGSKKETYHIEINSDEVLDYEPGDALGVVPANKMKVVEDIVALTGVDASHEVATAKTTASIDSLLKYYLNICYLLKDTVKKYAALTGHDIPDTRMSLYDLLRIYPVKDAAQFEEVIKILTPQAPRLYSISSSRNGHGENEVHITVSKNAFSVNDEERYGVCSEFLSSLKEGDEIEFFVQKTRHFKLPEGDKDVIMIGPGTGIAPFRSFLAERDAASASGRNWLFFGDQHFVTDFLYQSELQEYLQTGVLSKLDVAFSRDQKEKIYVQHRMKEQAVELREWIHNGAHLFVCGAKDPMSKDVEQTLIDIFMEEGKTAEEAKSLLGQLEEAGRYAKDVY